MNIKKAILVVSLLLSFVYPLVAQQQIRLPIIRQQDGMWWSMLPYAWGMGGDITTVGVYRVHTFTNSGKFTLVGDMNADVLIVAAGGKSPSALTGGAGAGGVIISRGATIPQGTYNITVGPTTVSSGNGANSIFYNYTAYGGGAGGSGGSPTGKDGGSGGGGYTGSAAGGAGTNGQGFAGGTGSGAAGTGGGGGASQVGAIGTASVGGNGGNGTNTNIGSLTNKWYGGGGGGSKNTSGDSLGGTGGGGAGHTAGGDAGVDGTGGGGGGSGATGSGGNGGSGIVIIQYLIQELQYGFGGDISYVGAYMINTFTNNGTLTVPSVNGISNARALVIAAGGKGSVGCGGSGAGGMIDTNGLTIPRGTYTVSVAPVQSAVGNGADSTFYTLDAVGGGQGGSTTGINGGSGSGAGGNNGGAPRAGGLGVVGQGMDGGAAYINASAPAGGGGGAGADGGYGTNAVSGAGGAGAPSDIYTVSNKWYAGGGGGGTSTRGLGGIGGGGDGSAAGTGVAGGINTGGGGGGGGVLGGNGGSGIIVIRYISPFASTTNWDQFEYATSTAASNAYVSSSPSTLKVFSESTIVTQGTYSMQVVATNGALNATLLHTNLPVQNLSGFSNVTFSLYSTITSSQWTLNLKNSNGITNTYTPTIAAANVWSNYVWDISGIADSNKNSITNIIIQITSTTLSNRFYIDNLTYGLQ